MTCSRPYVNDAVVPRLGFMRPITVHRFGWVSSPGLPGTQRASCPDGNAAAARACAAGVRSRNVTGSSAPCHRPAFQTRSAACGSRSVLLATSTRSVTAPPLEATALAKSPVGLARTSKRPSAPLRAIATSPMPGAYTRIGLWAGCPPAPSTDPWIMTGCVAPWPQASTATDARKRRNRPKRNRRPRPARGNHPATDCHGRKPIASPSTRWFVRPFVARPPAVRDDGRGVHTLNRAQRVGFRPPVAKVVAQS